MLFQPDHWNPSCTPDLQACRSTVLAHAQPFKQNFLLDELIASSNSFSTSTLISATLWFIKTCNRWFFQCFPSPTTVLTDEVLALRAFWVLAAGAGKLWSANICNQQLTSHCHLPAWVDNEMFAFLPSTSFWGQKKALQAVGPPEPTHCLQLLDLFSAQVKEAK